MPNGIFLLCYVLYLFIKFARNDYKSVKAKAEQKKIVPYFLTDLQGEQKDRDTLIASKARGKQVQYIVNDIKIPCSFERYYFDRLHMPFPIISIDATVINRYYEFRLYGDKLDTQTKIDVEAAKIFFFDRIHYMHSLN